MLKLEVLLSLLSRLLHTEVLTLERTLCASSPLTGCFTLKEQISPAVDRYRNDSDLTREEIFKGAPVPIPPVQVALVALQALLVTHLWGFTQIHSLAFLAANTSGITDMT